MDNPLIVWNKQPVAVTPGKTHCPLWWYLFCTVLTVLTGGMALVVLLAIKLPPLMEHGKPLFEKTRWY